MEKEKIVFAEYLKRKGLKFTKQREEILDYFLKSERHLTPDEMFIAFRKFTGLVGGRKTGRATIYRTLKLLAECGLAERVDFGDGLNRFEHKFAHPHHDHLICLGCGNSFEFSNPEIEKLQERAAKEHRFQVEHHRLEIYGYCVKCRKRRKK